VHVVDARPVFRPFEADAGRNSVHDIHLYRRRRATQ
jgi:hypothetical protein